MSIPKLTDVVELPDSEGWCARTPKCPRTSLVAHSPCKNAGPDLEEEEGEVDVEVGVHHGGLGPRVLGIKYLHEIIGTALDIATSYGNSEVICGIPTLARFPIL